MSLLTTLSQTMSRHGDKLAIQISTQEGGANPVLRLVVTAQLGPVPSNASEQEAAKRASLVMPLIIQGTAEDCEAQLQAHIDSYRAHIDQTADSINRMQRESVKADTVKAKKGGDAKATDAKATDAKASTAKASTADAEAPKAKEAATDTPSDPSSIDEF